MEIASSSNWLSCTNSFVLVSYIFFVYTGYRVSYKVATCVAIPYVVSTCVAVAHIMASYISISYVSRTSITVTYIAVVFRASNLSTMYIT